MWNRKIFYWILTPITLLPIENLTNINVINVIEKKCQGNTHTLRTPHWRNNFLNYLENRKFILFEDDIQITNLIYDDLEKIKHFMQNWLLEASNFFNNDIYNNEDKTYDYDFFKHIKLLGFNQKNHQNQMEIYLNYNDVKTDLRNYKNIVITFDIFKGTKAQFNDFINQELENRVLNFKELNFKNNTHNIQEWNETRSDFFWKWKYWVTSFNQEIDNVLTKLNEQFQTNITASSDVLFYGWEKLQNNNEGQLIFTYRRFGVKIKIPFQFITLELVSDLEIRTIQDEIDAINNEFNESLEPTEDQFTYQLRIDENDFSNFQAIDTYLEFSTIINKFKQIIAEIWHDYFISSQIIARFDYIKDNLNIERINNYDFHANNFYEVLIEFFTIQGYKITRTIRFTWNLN